MLDVFHVAVHSMLAHRKSNGAFTLHVNAQTHQQMACASACCQPTDTAVRSTPRLSRFVMTCNSLQIATSPTSPGSAVNLRPSFEASPLFATATSTAMLSREVCWCRGVGGLDAALRLEGCTFSSNTGPDVCTHNATGNHVFSDDTISCNSDSLPCNAQPLSNADSVGFIGDDDLEQIQQVRHAHVLCTA